MQEKDGTFLCLQEDAEEQVLKFAKSFNITLLDSNPGAAIEEEER